MTLLDQFESAFKRADKARYVYEPQPVARVVLLTDLDAAATEREEQELKTFFRALDRQSPPPSWHRLDGGDYQGSAELLTKLQELDPDLIITYRLLKERTLDLPYSLGSYLDHLSQASRAPLLVVPRDTRQLKLDEGTAQVMVITDSMTGDARIVNWGATFSLPGGDLFLTHIEDDFTFERYMEVISKLDSIDTETARHDILAQLLREPTEYIERCREAFAAAGSATQVHSVVKLGHEVTQYVELVREHQVDLLVIEGKDESQAAMSGLAYSLAVELRSIPLLIL
ncbi:MAG: hypothetical protein AB7N76_34745 [Planctomycetota bacterium]